MGRSVSGMISIKLKTRGKYFKFANLESIFMNDMKKFLYIVINLARRLISSAYAGDHACVLKLTSERKQGFARGAPCEQGAIRVPISGSILLVIFRQF